MTRKLTIFLRIKGGKARLRTPEVRREYERVPGSTRKYGKYGSLAFSPLVRIRHDTYLNFYSEIVYMSIRMIASFDCNFSKSTTKLHKL